MGWKWWQQRHAEPVHRRPIDDRVLPGVPDVFTGQDTTYAMVRQMTEDIRDRNWETAAEKGMAITLLAVIDDLERVLFPEGDGAD